MKTRILTTLVTLFSICSPAATAEWEPRGLCYTWTGDPEAGRNADDMLIGEFYDYNRNPDGDLFTYSGVYKTEKQGIARDLKLVTKARGTGAKNPTNSPDVHGQFASTLRELINGRYKILKKYYRYPYTVAVPHIYMPPSSIKSLESVLSGPKPAVEPESDFLPDEGSTRSQKRKKTGKATSYDSHVSWFGVFRGKVIAPKSMTFRFFAAADDALAVRFNNKLVLETGHFRPAQYRGNGIREKACNWEYTLEYQKELAAGNIPDRKDYVVRKLRSTPYCNAKFLGITGGSPIEVTEGTPYPIEIIIGNNAGKFLCYLLTQEVTTDRNAPLKLFRTNDSLPSPLTSGSSANSEAGPDFDENSEIWKIASPKKDKKSKKASTRGKKFEKL